MWEEEGGRERERGRGMESGCPRRQCGSVLLARGLEWKLACQRPAGENQTLNLQKHDSTHKIRTHTIGNES